MIAEPVAQTPAEAVAAFFSDPFDPRRSLQLNNRYWPGQTFALLDVLRDAEDALARGHLGSMRQAMRRILPLVPPAQRRHLVNRLVYSRLFTTRFEPIRFSLPLTRAFVDANLATADPAQQSQSVPGVRAEELRYVQDLAQGIYRNLYGRDICASEVAVRHVKASDETARRTTAWGDFSDYHLDQGKDFTCIIYLRDVGVENGCFSYVQGTPSAAKSHVLRALHQVVGNDMGKSLPEQTADLPLELRGSMGMGNFLDDDKRDRLRPARVDVTGRPGDGIIFNGYDMLHRGGAPLQGQRSAVFVSTRGLIASRMKTYLARLSASLWT